MGSFDTYCAICGGQPDVGTEVNHWTEDDTYQLWEESTWPKDCSLPIKPEEFTDLVFNDHDREFQQRVAYLGPMKGGRPTFGVDDFPPSREAILSVQLDSIDCAHDMVVEDYGGLQCRDGTKIWANVADNSSYLWAHETCLRLLPSLTHFTESTFWDLFRRTNTRQYEGTQCLLKGIDYLEIGGSHEQFVRPWYAAQTTEMRDAFYKLGSSPNPLASLRRLLLDDGFLWVFVAPDRFPIKEAFELHLSGFSERPSEVNAAQAVSKLPEDVLGSIATLLGTFDILSLLATSNHIRSKLLNTIDWAAKQALDSDFPWVLARGEEETTRWEKEVADAGGSDKAFPWFAYRWACQERSASMWNRDRICKILKQMERLAEYLGVLS